MTTTQPGSTQKPDISGRVLDIIKEVAGVDTVDLDKPLDLKPLELDSLDLMNVVISLEELLATITGKEVLIPEQTIKGWRTVGGILKYVTDYPQHNSPQQEQYSG